MDRSLRSKLRLPPSGDALTDAVNRVRMDAAYVLLDNPDSLYALLHYFSKSTIASLDKATEYLTSFRNSYVTPTTTAVTVDLSGTYGDLVKLRSVSTQLGEAHLLSSKAKIEEAICTIGGVTHDQMKDMLSEQRISIDGVISKAVLGLLRFETCFSDIARDAPERYRSSVRVPAAAELIKTAETDANAGDQKLALQKLALARVALDNVCDTVESTKDPADITPLDRTAVVTLTGTEEAPYTISSATDTIEITTTTESGDTDYTLPIPQSTPPRSVSTDLTDKLVGSDLYFYGDRIALLPFPYLASYTLVRYASTGTVTGDILTDVVHDFITEKVEPGDKITLDATYVISEVLSATELLLETTPAVSGNQFYELYPKQYFTVHVGNQSYEVDLSLVHPNVYDPITDAEMSAVLLGSISNVNLAHVGGNFEISTVASGSSLLVDENSLTRHLGFTAFYDNGAANNLVSFTIMGDINVNISFEIPDGMWSLESIRAAVEGSLAPTYISAFTLVDNVFSLIGLHGDNTLVFDPECSSQRIFEFKVLNQGKSTSITDIAAAWSTTGCPIAITESSTYLPVVNCPNVETVTLSGSGLVTLGLPSGKTVGTTTTIDATELVLGDILTSGSVDYEVVNTSGNDYTVSPAMPAVAVTCTVTCGGEPKYRTACAALETHDAQLRTLLYGLPASTWDLLAKQIGAMNKNLALSDLDLYIALLATCRGIIAGYNPYGVPEVDQIVEYMRSYRIDDGLWYLTGLMFNRFFFADVSDMYASNRLSSALGELVSRYRVS